MTFSSQVLAPAVTAGRDDVIRFFQHCLEKDGLWQNAGIEASTTDHGFRRYTDPLEFYESLLSWLENQRANGVAPWRIQGNVFVLPQASNVRDFLVSLRRIMDGLVIGGHPQSLQARYDLNDFIQFTVSNLPSGPWTFTSCSRADVAMNLHGFASWLLVAPRNHTLYIVTDDSLIDGSTGDADVRLLRREACLLHELGHARLGLAQYLHAGHNNGQLRSRPIDETVAWTYARSVCMCISAARSRVDRLLTDGDAEWRS